MLIPYIQVFTAISYILKYMQKLLVKDIAYVKKKENLILDITLDKLWISMCELLYKLCFESQFTFLQIPYICLIHEPILNLLVGFQFYSYLAFSYSLSAESIYHGFRNLLEHSCWNFTGIHVWIEKQFLRGSCSGVSMVGMPEIQWVKQIRDCDSLN
jgi:hypothetical protein